MCGKLQCLPVKERYHAHRNVVQNPSNSSHVLGASGIDGTSDPNLSPEYGFVQESKPTSTWKLSKRPMTFDGTVLASNQRLKL